MNPAPEDPRIRLLKRRAWRGLEAKLTSAEPGRYDNAPRPDHHLMIHLGPPARVTWRDGARRQAYVQTRGDIDVIPAGVGPVFEDADPTASLSLWVSPDLVEGAARGMGTVGPRRLARPSIQQRDKRLLAVALLIKSEVEAEAASDPLFGDSLAVAMAARLLERYGETRAPTPGATLSRARLRVVLDYIEAHLSETIRLDDLACVAGHAPSHFRALFRQTVHRSVHRYVIERRVRRAATLLERGGASIAEAALESGFCHQSHLARHMRRIMGRSPGDLRRESEAGRQD